MGPLPLPANPIPAEPQEQAVSKRKPPDHVCPERTTCRACGSHDLSLVLDLGCQYVSDFPASRDSPGVSCPIVLDRCGQCTLVQQRFTAPQELLYRRHYWYRSGVTDTMKMRLLDVVQAAAGRVDLKPGDVWLDVGANDGTLLAMVGKHKTELTRVGVEPAKNLAEECQKHCDLMIEDFWSFGAYETRWDTWEVVKCVGRREGSPSRPSKVITAIGMFYDLEDPNQFIGDVAKVLADDGVFVSQLMCLRQMVANLDVGNLAHEHLEFYTLRSLVELFNRHGLHVFDVEENDVNGGSYRVFAAKGPRPHDPAGLQRFQDALRREEALGLTTPDCLSSFSQEIAGIKKKVVDFLRGQRKAGKSIWVYGASTKGNVILQWLGLDSGDVDLAADRSPEKWTRSMVGSGVGIVGEAAFRSWSPPYALVLPYAFLPEFVTRERAWLAGGGKFIVPLPVPRLVSVTKFGAVVEELL